MTHRGKTNEWEVGASPRPVARTVRGKEDPGVAGDSFIVTNPGKV